jgi:hypothetical protein
MRTMAGQSPTYPSATAELTDYWNRRPNLSEKEWTRFYLLVRGTLMHASAPQLKSLPENREAYVVEFFQDKFLFTTPRAEHDLTEGSVRNFFRNYLIDKIRSLPGTTQASAFDDEDGESFVARIPEPESEEHELREFLNEVPPEALASSAIEFVATLDDRHRLMLAGHYCADDPIPMSTLFKGVNGYHYQAQKLGVTADKGSRNFAGYEHTLIGKWMRSLGVTPQPDNLVIVHFLFKTLCYHAQWDTSGQAIWAN